MVAPALRPDVERPDGIRLLLPGGRAGGGRAALPRLGVAVAPHRLHAGPRRGLREPGQPRSHLQLLRTPPRPGGRADVRREEERRPHLRPVRRRLRDPAYQYRKALDDQQERLLNTVSRADPVRFVLRSRFLVLLDYSTFDAHREALAAMAPLDEQARRRALDTLAPSPRIGVHVLAPFTPGLYRVRPADMEPAAGRGRDVVGVESGAVCWSTSRLSRPLPTP